jgi:hypothetical protein
VLRSIFAPWFSDPRLDPFLALGVFLDPGLYLGISSVGVFAPRGGCAYDKPKIFWDIFWIGLPNDTR